MNDSTFWFVVVLWAAAMLGVLACNHVVAMRDRCREESDRELLREIRRHEG